MGIACIQGDQSLCRPPPNKETNRPSPEFPYICGGQRTKKLWSGAVIPGFCLYWNLIKELCSSVFQNEATRHQSIVLVLLLGAVWLNFHHCCFVCLPLQTCLKTPSPRLFKEHSKHQFGIINCSCSYQGKISDQIKPQLPFVATINAVRCLLHCCTAAVDCWQNLWVIWISRCLQHLPRIHVCFFKENTVSETQKTGDCISRQQCTLEQILKRGLRIKTRLHLKVFPCVSAYFALCQNPCKVPNRRQTEVSWALDRQMSGAPDLYSWMRKRPPLQDQHTCRSLQDNYTLSQGDGWWVIVMSDSGRWWWESDSDRWLWVECWVSEAMDSGNGTRHFQSCLMK